MTNKTIKLGDLVEHKDYTSEQRVLSLTDKETLKTIKEMHDILLIEPQKIKTTISCVLEIIEPTKHTTNFRQYVNPKNVHKDLPAFLSAAKIRKENIYKLLKNNEDIFVLESDIIKIIEDK